MTPPATAPRYFHLGLAIDNACNDWNAITTTLDYLVSNRVAQGETIVVHDVTNWLSTKVALLWAVDKSYWVDYTARHIHRRNESVISTFWDIHIAKPMDALAVLYNTGCSAKDNFLSTADRVKECARIVEEHGIPVRRIPCKKQPENAAWPYVLTQSGQTRKYGDSYRIGHFYAPNATKQNARTWLWACIEPFSKKIGDYQLERFDKDPDGWWHFNLRRDYLG